jgi:hypothetical protein
MVLVKRAIQFGSRIANQSNRRVFGSNRAGKGSAVYERSQGAAAGVGGMHARAGVGEGEGEGEGEEYSEESDGAAGADGGGD